jgi:pyruvate dehydrogenase E2 component (dihydrolipoamide acetyltransferase)
MATEMRMTDPGEGIHEVEIVEIHVTAGDHVDEDDPLFTVESDKAVTEVPAPFSGEVTDIAVGVGDIVEVGQVLLTYETGGNGAGPAAEPEAREEPAEPETREEPAEPEEDQPESEDHEEEEPLAEARFAPAGDGERRPDEPEQGEQPEPTAEDRAPEAASDQGPRDSTFVREARPVPASPATRALARRLGVDLHDLEGSGPEGRIEPQDVQAAAERPEEEPQERAPADERAEEAADEWGAVRRVPLRGVRRATARRMAQSWNEIPHVTHEDVADITDLEAFRREHAEEVEAGGGKLTLTVFLIKAAIAALREHPRFNAFLDGDDLVLKDYFNIGVAVDTDEGLVVPVVRHADRMAMTELAAALVDLAGRMRAGDRRREDMAGGTFTITNPGGIGGTGFSPIINHPEVAILGAARAHRVPVLADDPPVRAGDPWPVVPRLHLPLVVAFDHRVNDGADAARFLRSVIDLLEDVPRMLLRV